MGATRGHPHGRQHSPFGGRRQALELVAGSEQLKLMHTQSPHNVHADVDSSNLLSDYLDQRVRPRAGIHVSSAAYQQRVQGAPNIAVTEPVAHSMRPGGRRVYSYQQDLLNLESCQASHIPARPAAAREVTIRGMGGAALQGHSDRTFVGFILREICQGFRISFDGSKG